MTAPGHGDPQADPRPQPPTNDRSGPRPVASWIVLGATLVVAVVVGAYLDWLWWVWYDGLVLTLAAMAIIVAAGIVALIGRGIVRRGALIALAIGAGLLIGQNVGPAREPLLYTSEGTMTLRLDSPVVAVATGPASCTNVASETEFQVNGAPNLRLDAMDRAWDSVSITVGDRWDAIEDGPGKDGVHFSIWGTDLAVGADGKPSMVAMEAVESSILEATFTNEGGSARFARLAPRTRPDLDAAPMDLVGTVEWTCGPVSA